MIVQVKKLDHWLDTALMLNFISPIKPWWLRGYAKFCTNKREVGKKEPLNNLFRPFRMIWGRFLATCKLFLKLSPLKLHLMPLAAKVEVPKMQPLWSTTSMQLESCSIEHSSAECVLGKELTVSSSIVIWYLWWYTKTSFLLLANRSSMLNSSIVSSRGWKEW